MIKRTATRAVPTVGNDRGCQDNHIQYPCAESGGIQATRKAVIREPWFILLQIMDLSIIQLADADDRDGGNFFLE